MASMASSEVFIADELAQARRERDLYVRLLRLGDERGVELLLREALSLIVDATGARQVYIELRAAGDEPSCRSVACGLSEPEVARVRTALAQGALARGLATGRTVITPAEVGDARSSVRPLRLGAALCTPIGIDHPLGALYLKGPQHRAHFTDADREAAELLARHLAPLADRLLAVERHQAAVGAPPLPPAYGLVGGSDAFTTLLRQIALVAPLDVPVCIVGDAGAGTTRVARALHDAGRRATGPYVVVDCCGLAAERGRLSRAVAIAAGGTLLLDDVGALDLDGQADVLAVLSHRPYRPVGSDDDVADVGVLVTAGTELQAAVDAGRFRDDLQRILGIMPLRVPSLAERRTDITMLAAHFLRQTCGERGLPYLTLSPGAFRAVEAAEWRGNVRELADVVAQAARRAADAGVRQIECAHLFPPAAEVTVMETTLQEATRRFQAALLVEVLEHTSWDVARTADRLDLRYAQVDSLIRTFGLDRGSR
ncbi:MAG TPA: sigma 54-interacting transcriptional regulator [Candidatus Binatia bacterium]|jgi:Nif-specific regulatory protein|nr:sigma 54-interacting transcriptional regulator [Candidatus Binatia bacterium]